MTRSQGLLLFTCALSLYSVGQVWLVQLSSYPLWRYVGETHFRAYHLAWWRSIWGVVLFPAILVSAGAVIMLWWRPAHVQAWMVWLGLALQVLLVAGTAVWWGPLMARLESPNGGLSMERYQLLIATHWLRVALVTGYGLLTIWMLARSAWAETQD